MLYLEHFGLDEPPFRITPHTDFFFDGADRGATLDALLYAILHDEGIVKVSGEVGSGKTMLCRVLMERLPAQVEIVYLANPSLGRDEIFHAIADDLGVDISQGRVTVALRELEEHLIDLYAEGRRVVLLIDEAHAMPEDTLEQVRLLSNLESNRHKLLQIVLFGQPELDAVLGQASMRQLKDRITHSFRMRPLSKEEIGKYLSFRMRAAGYRGPDIFSARAIAMIAQAASGLTRRVNILADKSLLAAYAENKHEVGARQARRAIGDSEFGQLLGERRRSPLLFGSMALVAGLAIGAGLHWVLSELSDRSRDEALPPPGISANRLKPPSAPAPAAPNLSDSGTSTAVAPAPSVSTMTVLQSKPAEPEIRHPEDSSRGSLVPKKELRLNSEAAKRLAAYRPGSNPLLVARLNATRELLEREPDGSYSIELFSTDNSDPARIERFLIRARELVPLSSLYVLTQMTGARYRLRILFGEYPDRDAATKGTENLPPKYRQAFRPELRTFSELREAL